MAEESTTECNSRDGSSNTDLLNSEELNLLPYGIRYYSMMLWLRGRSHLANLLQYETKESPIPNPKDNEKILTIAGNAIINFFRASQYVTKTHGEASAMIMPPLFVVYYNLWEVLFYLVKIYLPIAKAKKDENPLAEKDENPLTVLEKAINLVRDDLNEVLTDRKIKDVSARMFDLRSVQQMTLEQFKVIEQMGDLTSSDRKNIMKNKYYLDDDFEDNMFILDWSYCRFFAPGAVIYSKMVEYKMKCLELECFQNNNKESAR